ncbi:high mobility group B protein 13-like isoform X2 [Telopea speciosissima]|uniref:high mobility group B protein 13-like isoform X2 n=1 Tax=Telopea speciosissima TaxID=54955 RepID=UPI001CC69947|nr:high mobility group B protein 13-like isoform X2 [Telopea speciosissima]
MADTLTEMTVDLNPVHGKKVRSKRALKPKNQTANETNILAGKISQPSASPLPSVVDDDGKENSAHLSQPRSRKQTKKAKESKQSFEKELQEIQGKLEQMRLEKEKTEELLKVRDEMLKQKEEELENRGREQEKLQLELKKMQKLKEFKPTVSFPLVQSLREKEQEKNVKRKKKAGPAIKKPSPAYVLWCRDQWNEVKKENPQSEFKEISNILGSKWKNLSPEEKKPYEEKYQADKEAYLQIIGKEKRENEAMKLFEEEQKQKTAMELLEQYLQFKQEVEKETKKTRKEKDPLKPKQPLSAFFLFSKERRAALLQDNINILEIAKLAGEEWKNMAEEQRGPYEEMAKKQKEEYLREMEIYKQTKDEEAASLHKEEEEQMKIQKQEALQLLKKKEKAENIIKKTKENRLKKKKQKEEQNSDPKRPKKPASSFFLFSKEMRKELLLERPGISYSTLNTLISVKWKELNEADKQLWNVKAAEAMEAYKKEMEEYNQSTVIIANNNPKP